jgi:hypothetical protein
LHVDTYPTDIQTMRTIALFAVVLFLAPLAARAEQQAYEGHVVHSRRAPVVAHRVLPPFRGVHVYQGRGRK